MKCSFLIAFLLLSVLFDRSMATDRTVPITFSVTSSGINRFLAGQWNAAGFTKTWSGSYQGLSYSIVLNRPVISLATNAIKITLSLTINATEGTTTIFNGAAAVTPTLTIPSTTISMDKIYSQYTDLHNAIIAVIPDWRLQQKVEEALAPISWIIYQGKVMNESTARFTEGADIGWKGLPTLTFAVANDEVNLTVTPTIYSNEPDYSYKHNRPANTLFGIKIISNNAVSFNVGKGKLYNILGDEIGTATPESMYPPVYNSDTQKYETIVYFRASQAIANTITIHLYFNLKRNNMETLWYASFTSFGTNTEWTANAAQLSAIRGE